MKIHSKLLTFLLLSSGSLTVISFINKFIKLSAVSKDTLLNNQPEKSLCYKWRFGNIHYTKTGTGKPLLLIHDLESHSSGYEWKQLTPTLKENHTIYTIDLIGFGRSQKPNLTYTNFLYVQLISDFIKSEIGQRSDIIVTGSASSIAIMACNHTPDLFDQLMLINPESILSSSQIPNKHSKIYKRILDFPIIGTLLYHIASSKQEIQEQFVEEYFYNPYCVKSDYINAYYESAHLGLSPKSVYASITCNYMKSNVTQALKNINNSIYIVGGQTVEGIENIISEYKQHNPAIEHSIISETKKLPQLENPIEVKKVISIFFS